MNAVPGGYESEQSDLDDDFFDGFYTGKSNLPTKIVEKSPLEQKKLKLMEFLKNSDVAAMREELDNDVKGFDIDENIDGYWNLLYHACFLAVHDVVSFLIEERGATVNMTRNSETPLMVSCYSDGDSEDVLAVVKALIKESTVIGAANLLGITPLMFASKHGHTSVVRYLLALNDAFDAIDNEGTNALFHAIDGKHEDIAKILIEAGIDLNVSNKFRCTARDYSRNENCEAIFKLFPAEIIRYQTPGSFMSYNRFEDMIPGIAEM